MRPPLLPPPPGLHNEPATERSIEPLAARRSHVVNDGPPRSPFSLTGSGTTSSLLPVAGKSLPREREASTTPQEDIAEFGHERPGAPRKPQPCSTKR